MSSVAPLAQTVWPACHTRAVLEERYAHGQLSPEDTGGAERTCGAAGAGHARGDGR